jgi:hypothetical protein
MPTEADTYTDLYRLSKDDKVESWGLVPAGGLMTFNFEKSTGRQGRSAFYNLNTPRRAGSRGAGPLF